MSVLKQNFSKPFYKWLYILSLIGFLVSLYSTYHHLEVTLTGTTDAFCNINETLSCDEIAKSPYSEPLGVPMGVWGLGFFLAIIFCLYVANSDHPKARDHLSVIPLIIITGSLSSIALALLSAIKIKVFCPTCIFIYLVNFSMLGVFWKSRVDFSKPKWDKNFWSSFFNSALVVIFTVAIFQFIKPYLAPHPSTLPDFKMDFPQKMTPKNPEEMKPQMQAIEIDKSPYSGLGEDYRKGSDQAKVTVVEFADFQCPACSYLAEILKKLEDYYGNKVLFVFKNFPLDPGCNKTVTNKIHEHACTIAVLARCAGQYGKFWSYHDLAFSNQQNASGENAENWGKQIGLTVDQIQACKKSGDLVAKIKADAEQAEKLGIEGTPTLFINGQKYFGNKSFDEIKIVIDSYLNQ